MDGQTLQQLFSGTNPFLAQMGEKAFNLDQQKRQADLASIMGQEQRAQAMHPLDMTARETTNRLNASTAGLNEYALKAKPDAETAKKAAMQEMLSKMDEATKAQFKSTVTRNMQIAAMAKANGGVLPPGLQMSPEEIQMFSPKNLDAIIKHGQTFLEFDPEEIAKRQRAAEAERLARIKGQVQMDVKSTPTPGKGTASVDLPKTYGEVVAAMAKYKKASERIAYLKSVLPGLPQELQVALQPSYVALKKQADAEINARMAGEVDIAGATKGKVPVNPAVDLGDAPNAVTSRPERQTSGQRITIYKDGKPVGTIPIEQKAQAIQQGYTIK